MEDDVFGPLQGFEGAENQILPALAENLDRNIVGNPVLLDQAPTEVEFDLGGGGKADFDLLEPDPHQHVEELELLFHAHGNREGLIAVAKIDAAPDRGGVDGLGGPLAIRKIDLRKGPVFGNG